MEIVLSTLDNIFLIPRSSCSPLSPFSSSESSFSPQSPKPILYVNRDPNWAVKMDLPLNNFNHFTREALSLVQGKRLTPEAKKEVVHKIVETVRQKTHHATRPQFSTIAQRMVAKYPESLQDKIEDSIVGSGYDTILNKLVSRNQNLNRGNSKMCLSAKTLPLQTTDNESCCDEPQIGDRAGMKKDSYGCVKWMPEVAIDEVKDKEASRDSLSEMYSSTSTETDMEQIE